MNYRAAVLTGHKRFDMQALPLPDVGPGEALVCVRAVNVCPTDIKKWNNADIDAMLKETPLILGHEIAGSVVSAGADVTGFSPGDRVAIDPVIRNRNAEGREVLTGIGSAAGSVQDNAALLRESGIGGGFAEIVKVPAENLIAIPDGLSYAAASLIEPLADIVHGIALAGDVKGRRCGVYGLGPMGLLHVELLKHLGAEVVGVEPRADRRELARVFGASSTAEPGAVPKLDMAFIVAGGPALKPACQDGLAALDQRGTLVIFASGPVDAELSFNLNKVHYACQKIVGVVGFRREDAERTIEFLMEGAVDVARIRQPLIPLEELGRGFAETGSEGTLKFAIDLPEKAF